MLVAFPEVSITGVKVLLFALNSFYRVINLPLMLWLVAWFVPHVMKLSHACWFLMVNFRWGIWTIGDVLFLKRVMVEMSVYKALWSEAFVVNNGRIPVLLHVTTNTAILSIYQISSFVVVDRVST